MATLPNDLFYMTFFLLIIFAVAVVVVEPLTLACYDMKAMHHFYTVAWGASFCNYN